MARRTLFGRLGAAQERTLADVLRTERAGGVMLLAGTVAALVWANSRWSSSYESLSAVTIGPQSLHLHLSLAAWAQDGLLAIFFFVIGLELKRELVAGELRHPATAVVPAAAAAGGMIVPALLYLAVNAAAPDGTSAGWAVPTATDIAFAVAVLSLVGRGLPSALRAFLLTLAVVDDLLAILIIAIFFTDQVSLGWLAVAAAAVLVFGCVARTRPTWWWLLVPLALGAWAAMHASGVHATIAGVALGLVVPAVAKGGERRSVAQRWEHAWRPVSAGVAVPLFALFAAGVVVSGAALREAFNDPASQGVALGLVLGKPIGIVLATLLVATFTKAALDPGLTWWDIVAIGAVGGIGFTVSLLVNELTFEGQQADHVTMGVLVASACAAVLGGTLLAWRARGRRGGARPPQPRPPRPPRAVST